MASSPTNPSPRIANLMSSLRLFSPRAEFTSFELPNDALLFTTENDLAVFAFAGADTAKSYKESYTAFRQLYSARHEMWDSLNLTFVLCLDRRTKELEQFCNTVETDVYFCRKFTLSLDRPLSSELSRLPFLPFATNSTLSVRPLPAQRLLRACNVPAKLARDLQLRGSETSIIDKCLDSSYGMPAFKELSHESLAETTTNSPDSVFIKQLTIENFRAYRRPQTFDLDADLILLYGPNGFGKTSFFDAIDFVSTGDIGRLTLNSKKRFEKAAKHLDSQSSDSYVSAVLGGSARDTVLRRSVLSRSEATIGGKTCDRKQVLQLLTGQGQTPLTEYIEQFISLFRATHLFSQEFQALTRDFKSHCRLSTEVVSRLLSFDDYVNASQKSTKVRSGFTSRISERNGTLTALRVDRAKIDTELRSFRDKERERGEPSALVNVRSNVVRLVVGVGIAVHEDLEPEDQTSQWRTEIEERLSSTETSISDLERIGKDLSLNTKRREELQSLDSEIESKQRELHGAVAARDRSRINYDSQMALFTKSTDEYRRLAQAIELLDWQIEMMPAYRELELQYTALINQSALNDKQLVEANTLRVQNQAEINEANRSFDNINEQIDSTRTLLDQAKNLSSRELLVDSHISAIADLDSLLDKQEISLNELDREELTLKATIDNASTNESAAKAIRAGIERSHSDLQRLLDAILAHVTDANCPACGATHASQQDLMDRISATRHDTPQLQVAINAISVASKQIAEARSQLDSLKLRRIDLESAIQSSRQLRSTLSNELESFRVAYKELGYKMGEDDGYLLINKINDLEQVVSELLILKAPIDARRSALVRSAEQTSIQIRNLEQESATLRDAIQQTRNQLDRIREDASSNAILMDRSADDLTSDRDELALELGQIQKDVANQRSEHELAEAELAQLDRIVEHAEKLLAAVEAERLSIQAAINRFDQQLLQLSLTRDFSHSDFESAHLELTRYAMNLRDAKHSIAGLERATNAAVTAAAAEELLVRLDALDEQIRSVEAEQDRDETWSSYFGKRHAKLESQQHDAVERYTRLYGPFTTTIQRRLRAVSGFADINLQPQAGTIDIRVTRNGEELPPVDFFSQSEQQILVLSLFMTACITQSWSSYSPILMDDPVTHFDDLNAYSFLDFIAGLLDSPIGRKQFIVSTCDERLFQLTRQRFKYLHDRLRIYRFSSIGTDGPCVQRCDN